MSHGMISGHDRKMMEYRHAFMVGFIYLLTLFGNLKAATIDVSPVNMAAVLGENVNLTCTVSGDDAGTGDPFEWREYITNPQTGERIYGDPPGEVENSDKYEVNGYYPLLIKNLEWLDGGLYACSLWSEDGLAHSADLLVFDLPDPQANSMVEGEAAVLTCLVQFAGPRDLLDGEIPYIEMLVNGHNLVVTQVMSEWIYASPYTITAEGNYTAVGEDNGADFTCVASTSDPSYSISASSTMDIQFHVQTPGFYPDSEIFYVGDTLECIAEGNPDPSYTWTPIQTPDGRTNDVDGAYLDIVEGMEGYNSWTCYASNTLQGEESSQSSSIEFTAYPAPSSSDNDGSNDRAMKIAVGVCVPVGVCIIVVLLVVFLYVLPQKKEKSTDCDLR